MSPRQIAVLIGGVVLLVGIFLVLRPAADPVPTAGQDPSAAQSTEEAEIAADEPTEKSPAEEPSPTAIKVREGQPVGGVATIKAKRGEEVAFTVDADAPEEVHVHGFDVSSEVGKGEPAKFAFKADLDGIYEVELEHSAVPIAELEIEP